MAAFVTIVFNGIAYGVLLFLMSVGLSVSMGMMRFVNLTQLSFSMLGGYLMIAANDLLKLPFLVGLPFAFVMASAAAALLERLLLRHFYDADELAQVLLTFGLILISISLVSASWGSGFRPVALPPELIGQVEVFGLKLERYRIFLIVAGILISVSLFVTVERTRFGAMIRACVDSRRAASGCGIDIRQVFAWTMALGGGLAGLGGALSANLLVMDPNFPLRYLVSVMIVVSLGGVGNLYGSMFAALLIGVADVAGKYYLPELGGIFIYLLPLVVLRWRPDGLVIRRF